MCPATSGSASQRAAVVIDIMAAAAPASVAVAVPTLSATARPDTVEVTIVFGLMRGQLRIQPDIVAGEWFDEACSAASAPADSADWLCLLTEASVAVRPNDSLKSLGRGSV